MVSLRGTKPRTKAKERTKKTWEKLLGPLDRLRRRCKVGPVREERETRKGTREKREKSKKTP